MKTPITNSFKFIQIVNTYIVYFFWRNLLSGSIIWINVGKFLQGSLVKFTKTYLVFRYPSSNIQYFLEILQTANLAYSWALIGTLVNLSLTTRESSDEVCEPSRSNSSFSFCGFYQENVFLIILLEHMSQHWLVQNQGKHYLVFK